MGDFAVIEISESQSAGAGKANSPKLILEATIATIMDIVVKAWPEVVNSSDIGPQSHENHITDKFRWKMVAERNKRPGLKYLFLREVQSDQSNGTGETGKIDIYVSKGSDESEYFAMECKRITGHDKKNAKHYIEQGVHRFVKGKYSFGLSHASMVGYVCHGTIAEAAEFIKSSIGTHNPQKTKMLPKWPWQAETRYGSVPNLYSTKHRQDKSNKDIKLLHLFLAFP